MPPKKTETKSEGATAPKAKSTSTHASYQAMITDAIIARKDRYGSSRQALKKYVRANNNIIVSDKMFDSLFNKALKTGVEKGIFEQPKGASGGTKLAKKAAKPPAPKKAVVPKKETTKKEPKEKKVAAPKKPAAKKEPKEKKAATPKKAVAKKETTKKAPAVVDKPTVLTKTKSGRVAKTSAKPAGEKKKAAPKKAAAPKKDKTPKKAADAPTAA